MGCSGGGGEIGDDAATDTGPDAVAADVGLDAPADVGSDDAPGSDGGADTGTDTGVDAGTCTIDGDCPDLVRCTSSTELTTQTYVCTAGVCVEDRSNSDDCAADDADTCGRPASSRPVVPATRS